MEKEICSKIFMLNNYENKLKMNESVKLYINKLKLEYPNAIITKEFYKGENILVRVALIETENKTTNKDISKGKGKDDWYIRQRGAR